jgi:Tfp pilus assembly protein PilF
LLDQLEQVDDARTLYKRYVATSKGPQSLFVYARFLARRGEMTEALDQCEKATKTCTPEQMAANCVHVLYLGKSTDNERKRVAVWLEAAVEKDPEKLVLINYLAGFYNLQGEYGKAEKWYRKAMEINASDPTPLNNLAWLLAFKEEKNAEALELIEKAIRLTGHLATLLDTRGVIHLRGGRYDLALADLKEAAAEAPKGSVYFHLALAQLKANNMAAAQVALHEATHEYGLREDDLHPLEREAYRMLCKRLGAQIK